MDFYAIQEQIVNLVLWGGLALFGIIIVGLFVSLRR